eukprot:TRINITY_DN2710_c0_g1_i1.p1 TRINITY_DN2710_c0_g1~~TRINITY_DN2710_c0_g1_i1.p1  ORF type:complete len:122 (+),score=18.12 TRINITY_DN2710_c0_g1_i1:151-516(+)
MNRQLLGLFSSEAQRALSSRSSSISASRLLPRSQPLLKQQRFGFATWLQDSVAHSPGPVPMSMKWKVWRIDDHGHRYELAVEDTKEEAEAFIKAIEDRNVTFVGVGHKQGYWCEEFIVGSV